MKFAGFYALLLLSFAAVGALAGPVCQSVHLHPQSSQDRALLIHELLEKSLSSEAGHADAKKKAQEALQLDDMNFTYFLALYQKNKSLGQNETLKLYPATDGRLIAFPIGALTTPKDINQKFKAVNYSDIKKDFDGSSASSAVLILRKLQAGTGSSMTRRKYFASRPEMPVLLGMNPIDPKLGAKGTDLLVEIEHPLKPGTQVEITIAELQLLQALEIAKTGSYSELIIQDIVGPETQNRLNQIWLKKSLIDPNLTYAQLFERTKGIGRATSVFQAHVPTIDEA
ncbi:MAG: hypothetical protein ACXWC9_05610, partial [Pseudobdellovibrionaceae bacterium]